MLTGNEPINPSEVQIEPYSGKVSENYIAQGVHTASGITFKQHMVVEFVKAFLANSNLSDHTNVNETHWQFTVSYAIDVANEVIKQLNQEQ